MPKKKPDTLLMQAGRRKDLVGRTINPPVHHASTITFESHAELRAAVRDMGKGYFYGRMGTPTTWALEEALAELEGGAGARLYPSGIAAVTTSLLTSLKAGDHLLMVDTVYEPTRKIARGLLQRFGIETSYYDPLKGAAIAAEFRDNTRAIFLESPGSLTMEIQDLPAIAEVAHEHNATVIFDNSWATPLYHNPLGLGADLVVHAATKYLSGHADVMMGAIVAGKTMLKTLQRTSAHLGQTVAPDDAYLTLRGMRTLGVRLERHQKNGLEVARWLRDQPLVDRVLHPAFEDCPGHDIWARDFSGAPGLFSIVLRAGDFANMGALTDDLEHFSMGFSWGGYESLVLPQDPTPVRTARPWQAPGPLVRLSIGLEDPDDLIPDLEAGLARFQKTLD